MGSIETKRFVSDYVRLVPLCLPKEIADSNRQFQQRASRRIAANIAKLPKLLGKR
jgi:hypothetical protein